MCLQAVTVARTLPHYHCKYGEELLQNIPFLDVGCLYQTVVYKRPDARGVSAMVSSRLKMYMGLTKPK